jgi:ubiquinone/menaquinone biosynthesis C-methylase UbiE
MTLKPWLAHVLRFFFKHLYTTFAWAYDLVAWTTSMGQWRTWQSAAYYDHLHSPILELGSGPGHLLVDFHRKGYQTVAIDASKQMARISMRRLRQQGFPPVVVHARAQYIPLPADTFANVVATFPSEFILERGTLDEIRRVLQPGGELVVIAVERITGQSIQDRVADWLYRFTGQAGDPGDQWKKPLEEMGFIPRLDRVHQPRADVLRFRAKKPTA